jgi:hypothetical protein
MIQQPDLPHRRLTQRVLLVDLPVGLDEILGDQQQLLGVIGGGAARPVPSCRKRLQRLPPHLV